MLRERPQQRGELDLWRGKDTCSDLYSEMLVNKMPQKRLSKSEGSLQRSRRAAAVQARRFTDNPKFW